MRPHATNATVPSGNRRALLGAGSVVFIALLLAGLHIRNYPVLSPIDEVAHFDNVVKESRFELVRRGDPVGDDALRAAGCRGIDAPGNLPDCVPVDQQPAAPLPNFNTAYMHPPLYYVVEGLGARSLRGVGIASNLLLGARFMDALWFASGLLLLFAVMGELGLRGVVRAAASVMPAIVPFVVYQAATVTNDVTAIPSAALVLLAVLRFDRGRWRSWTVSIACATAVLLRMTNVFGVMVGIGFLCVRWVQKKDPEDRRRIVHAIVAATATTLVAIAAWIALIGIVAQVPASALPLARMFPKNFSVDQLFQSVAPLVPPTYGLPDVAFWTRHSFITLQAAAIGWPVVVGPALAVARRRTRPEGLALGVPAAAAMLIVGPTMVIINAVSSDTFLGLPIPTRMALSVVPGCLAAFAGGIRSRWASRALVGFVSAGIAGSLVVAGGLM